jgi:BirA family biotin operon repressor/biotin-[acetyl-CoA-carboxylase] ligase
MGQSSAVTDAPAARPPLDLSRLRGSTVDRSLAGFSVEVLDEAGSTNAVVADRAREGAAPGLVVVAEHQTAGRGRLDRGWETPARAALTFSVLVRPTRHTAAWPWLPLLTGVAVATGVQHLGLPAELKWPNDVLITGRKVAGILVERVDTPDGPSAVLGIGVNVSTTGSELPDPPPGAPAPTSLDLAQRDGGPAGAAAAPLDRTGLLVVLLSRLAEGYDAWQSSDHDAELHDAYAALCVTVPDRPVRVLLPSGETLTGLARQVTADGGLLVDTATGPVTVTAGDVLHVRAVGR